MTTPNFATHRTASYSPEEAWEGAWFDQGLAVPYEGQTRMRLLFANGVSDLGVDIDTVLQEELDHLHTAVRARH